MNYYFKRQQRELAARRQREADIADKMRRKKEAQRSQQRTTTEPIKKPNLEQTPRRDGSTTSPPPPPSSATHSAPDANRVKSQSHRSPGGTDLGNWVCVTREDGTVYYFHKVTKTVRWNRPEDHLLGQIEKEIGKQQRDVASRQTQRIQEVFIERAYVVLYTSLPILTRRIGNADATRRRGTKEASRREGTSDGHCQYLKKSEQLGIKEDPSPTFEDGKTCDLIITCNTSLALSSCWWDRSLMRSRSCNLLLLVDRYTNCCQILFLHILWGQTGTL